MNKTLRKGLLYGLVAAAGVSIAVTGMMLFSRLWGDGFRAFWVMCVIAVFGGMYVFRLLGIGVIDETKAKSADEQVEIATVIYIALGVAIDIPLLLFTGLSLSYAVILLAGWLLGAPLGRSVMMDDQVGYKIRPKNPA